MRRLAVVVLCAVGGACGGFGAESSTAAPDAAADGPIQAIPDGGAAADAAKPEPFCATRGGTICEDFDDPQSAVLSDVRIDSGGVVEVVSAQHVSPPNALRAAAQPQGAATCKAALRASPSNPVQAQNGFRAEFQLRVVKLGGAALVGARVFMVTTTSAPSCNYALEVTPTGATLSVDQTSGNVNDRIPLTVRPLLGAWSKVVIDVDGIAGGRTISVTVDGKTAAKGVDLPGECQNETQLEHVAVGLLCGASEATGAVEVDVDDVRVDVK